MPRQGKQTTPEDFPVQSPPPSGDYSYTLEIVMQMQQTMGKLVEAIDSLKADSREYRTELKGISQEVRDLAKEHHGWAVGSRWVLGFSVAVAGFLGWAIKAYLDFIKK